ncbi:hypothetical protein GCM10023210_04110 [Chryseobacterium ginsengisoli]|uniref:Uncharacterized protein n=1 Tax=Chryseobacterium ginsengisoli TaxID=363853 RepID=A0ABP9LS67_9FLAO
MEINEITTKDVLKNYFKTGRYPTENQFSDFIDSYWHKEENIPKEKIEGLDALPLDYQLQWSPATKKLSLVDSKGNLISEISLQTIDNVSIDLRYNSATLSLEVYNKDNELLYSIPIADFVQNVATQLVLNSNNLQLKDSKGAILSNIIFTVSNIGGLQEALNTKLTVPELTNNYVGRWSTASANFVEGVLQDNGSSAGVGNSNYNNIIWAVDSVTQAALIAPRMTQAQRLIITLDITQAGAVVYQTNGSFGYYLWNGTSWQTLGENIATADLSNTQARTFTQNANFTWNTLGNPYYLKGLADIGSDHNEYSKVLRIDPTTKQVVEGDAFVVTIPDNLPNPSTPTAQTLNIVHTYTNSPTALDTNVVALNDFIMNISNLEFTSLAADDWNVVNATNNDSSYIDRNSGIVLKCLNPGPFTNRQVMACAYPNLVLPNNKNWVFTIGCTVGALHISHMGVVGIAASSATTNVGMLQSFLSSLSAGWDQYNCLNFIESTDDTTPVENGFAKVNNNTLIFTKVGNILNTTVRSGNNYKSLNIDVTGINSFKPLLNLVKKSWDYPNNSCTSDFGMYYIQP